MPSIRPFRALRYDASSVPDLAAVLCPPYDVIDERSRAELIARDEHNAVRLELPVAVGEGEGARSDPYLEAARTLAEWRTDGVLVKDREPTLTVHEMVWPAPDGRAARALGVFGRLRLEPFGPGAGVRPHERTMSGPKEDRYRLLRATGVNTSPVVLLADADERLGGALHLVSDTPPSGEATTADGVRHRFWVLSAATTEGPGVAEQIGEILGGLGAHPLTIADGHHRYETALRYREERGRNRACESDPAWDYVLALVYPHDLAPPALPTHRVVRDGPTGDALLAGLAPWFEAERLADADEVLARMSEAPLVAGEATGSGRLGLVSRGAAAILRVRPGAFGELLDAALSEASRGLDVNVLAATLERVMGVDAASLAAGGRLAYVKEAAEAARLVGSGDAACCFILDPMPVTAVTRVAASGEVMPQKSTFFHPKAPTGLLFGPLEW